MNVPAVLEPLVPPECDCSGLPFMPLEVGRLLDSDLMALSTGDEFKAALMLWCKSWAQAPAASLPDDDRILARWSGATPSEWKQMREMALRGWVKCSDGRLYHPLIADLAVKAKTLVALGDLIGLDVTLQILDILFKETGDAKYRACPLLRKYVRAGLLGRKTGRGFYTY